MANAAYNVLGMSNNSRYFHICCEYEKLGYSLHSAFRAAFTAVHNCISFKKIAYDIREQHKRSNIYKNKAATSISLKDGPSKYGMIFAYFMFFNYHQ